MTSTARKYVDMEKALSEAKEITKIGDVTVETRRLGLGTFAIFKRDVLPSLAGLGDAGLEILKEKMYFEKTAPVKPTAPQSGNAAAQAEYQAKLVNYGIELKSYEIKLRDYKANRGKIFAFLWFFVDNEVRTKLELRRSEVDELSKTQDHLGLWNLLKNISEEYCKDNINDIFTNYYGLKWDQEKTLSDFLVTYERAVEELMLGGKVLKSKDKTARLSGALKHIPELQVPLGATILNTSSDAAYPEYATFKTGLIQWEKEHPEINKGASKQNGKGNTSNSNTPSTAALNKAAMVLLDMVNGKKGGKRDRDNSSEASDSNSNYKKKNKKQKKEGKGKGNFRSHGTFGPGQCFKCGKKGHGYQSCHSSKTPKCDECGGQHLTAAHDLWEEWNDKANKRKNSKQDNGKSGKGGANAVIEQQVLDMFKASSLNASAHSLFASCNSLIPAAGAPAVPVDDEEGDDGAEIVMGLAVDPLLEELLTALRGLDVRAIPIHERLPLHPGEDFFNYDYVHDAYQHEEFPAKVWTEKQKRACEFNPRRPFGPQYRMGFSPPHLDNFHLLDDLCSAIAGVQHGHYHVYDLPNPADIENLADRGRIVRFLTRFYMDVFELQNPDAVPQGLEGAERMHRLYMHCPIYAAEYGRRPLQRVPIHHLTRLPVVNPRWTLGITSGIPGVFFHLGGKASGKGKKRKRGKQQKNPYSAHLGNGVYAGGVWRFNGKEWILLDSGCSYHVERLRNEFQDFYHPNTGKDKVELAVADGGDLAVSHIGYVPNLGLAIVAPTAALPIASIGELTKLGNEVLFSDSFNGMTHHGLKVAVRITHPQRSDPIYGVRAGVNHFWIEREDYRALREYNMVPSANGAAATAPMATEAPHSGSTFTREQLERIEEVNLLHIACGHPSYKVLMNSLTYATTVGLHLTPQDVVNWSKHYASCPGCLAGKTVKPSYVGSLNEPPSAIAELIHVDIYPLPREDDELSYGGIEYLVVAVDDYSGYLHAVNLKSKHTEDLVDALNSIVGHFAQFGHTVQEIHADSESGLIAAKTAMNLNGIRMMFSPPAQHAQRIERNVQTIKQRAACIRASSPVQITGKLEADLVFTAIYFINSFPTSKYPTMSPRIVVEGKRYSVLSMTSLIPFGTVAHVPFHEDGIAKSRLAVVLGPSEITRDAHNCYVLDTGKRVTRATSTIVVLERVPAEFPWPVKVGAVNKPTAMSHRKKKRTRKNKNDKAVLRQLTESAAEIPRPVPVSSSSGPSSGSSSTSRKISNRPLEYIAAGDLDEADSVREGDFPADFSDAESESAAESQPPSKVARSEPSQSQQQAHQQQMLTQKLATLKSKSAKKAAKQAERKRAEAEQAARDADAAAEAAASAERQRRILELPVLRKSERQALKKGSAVNRADTLMAIAGRIGLKSSLQDMEVYESLDLINAELLSLLPAAYRTSIREALQGEHAQESIEAINDEIQNMLSYKVGHYVRFSDIPVDKRKNILQSFMFLKDKTTPDGAYERTKARMVGNGANQKDHMYDLVSSTTVALASVFLMFNIATHYKCKLATYDIKGAFLHAPFQEGDEVTYIRINKDLTKLWIQQDPGAADYVDDRGELLLQLDKFIYGLKQSPLKFQMHLINVLTELGYRQLTHDECMFTKHVGKDFSIITVHVDDILQVSTSSKLYKELKDGLTKAYGTITTNNDAESYLGMSIERSAAGDYLKITQQGLIKKLVEQYPMHERDSLRKYPTPAANDLFDTEASNRAPKLDAEGKSRFLSLIMTLMYVARLSRPDILLPVTFLATRTHEVTERDVLHALRVVRYLEATPTVGVIVHCSDFSVRVMCDASYAVHADSKGHTGFYLALGSSLSYVHGRSGKQKMASTSSTDAEILALCEAVKMAVWMRGLLAELQITPLQPIQVAQDNMSAIYLVESPSSPKRSRHLLTKIAYVKDMVLSGAVKVTHLGTKKMTADMLTKTLQGHDFHYHAGKMLGVRWSEYFPDPENDNSD